jgi:copper(I)-binding protein
MWDKRSREVVPISEFSIMKWIACLFAVVLAASAASAQDSKQDYKVGALQIANPWSRAAPKGATTASAYLKITNTGTAPDRLVGGSWPMAGRLEIHQMVEDNGVMKMRLLKDGIEIKPGETVEFKPGVLHLMLVDLKQPIQKGDRVKGTLTFEKAGSIEVEYPALGVGETGGSAAPAHGHDAHGMH